MRPLLSLARASASQGGLVSLQLARHGVPDLRVSVAGPEGPPPAAGYPLLCLLDAGEHSDDSLWPKIWDMRAQLGPAAAELVLVVVDPGRLLGRVRDYTPPCGDYRIPAGLPGAGMPTGGADAFLALLEESVLPLVSRRWRLDPARMALVGEGLAGLCALHAVMAPTSGFTRFAALRPPLWYGDEAMLSRAGAFAGAPRYLCLADGEVRSQGALRFHSPARTLLARLGARLAETAFVSLPDRDAGGDHALAVRFALGDVDGGSQLFING